VTGNGVRRRGLDHGRVFAHHVRTENGYARNDGESAGRRLRARRRSPRRRRHAECPGAPLGRVSRGVSSLELPQSSAAGHIYVRVTIGGRGLDFVLDSGASGITIDATTRTSFGLAGVSRAFGGDRRPVHDRSYDRPGDARRRALDDARTSRLRSSPLGWRTNEGSRKSDCYDFDFLASSASRSTYENERVTVVS